MITLTSIGIANALGMAIIFLKKTKANPLANRALAVLFILIAIRLGKVIALRSDIELVRSIYFNLMHGVYLALGPALLFYINTITKKRYPFKRQGLWHLIPALLALLLASTIRPAVGEAIWLDIYQLLLLFPVPYLLLSFRAISLSKNKSVWAWSILSFITLVIAMNWAFFLVDFPFYVVTATLVTGLFYLMLIRFTNTRSEVHTNSERVAPALAQIYFNQLQKFLQDGALQDSELNLDQAAQHLELPRHQLSKIVNQIAGQSFPHYISAKRIDHAKQLLLTRPDLKIAAVAFESGFHTLSRFNTAFKTNAGMSPSQFREKNLL